MNISVTITATAIASSVLVLFAAYAASAQTLDYGVRNLRQVELIGLDTNICTLGIADQMKKEGFLVTDRNEVSDAVLEVKVQTDGSLSDHSKVETARYSAVLVGAADRVLFAAGGKQHAHDLEELCEDIGDDIAHQLGDRIDA
jgi:hypothetical protein